jgi:hypothetical protein
MNERGSAEKDEQQRCCVVACELAQLTSTAVQLLRKLLWKNTQVEQLPQVRQDLHAT